MRLTASFFVILIEVLIFLSGWITGDVLGAVLHFRSGLLWGCAWISS